MAITKAKFGIISFPNNWKLLEVERERRLIEHPYPHNRVTEHEDIGEIQRFIIECFFTKEQSGYFETLKDQFELNTPDFLYVPGRGIFWCRFEKFLSEERAGYSHHRQCRLEFVETMSEDVAHDRVEDYEIQIQEVLKEAEIAEVLAEFYKLEERENVFKKLYTNAMAFAQKIQVKVGEIQQEISDTRGNVQRPFKELQRLAGQIERLSGESIGLYNDAIKYADVPYMIARSFKNISNMLTSVARQFSPPPTSNGEILSNQLQGRVVTYTVRKGDTLELICVKFYGTVATMSCVMDTNGINDPLSLQTGDTLLIPELEGRPLKKVTVELPKSEVGKATCSEL